MNRSTNKGFTLIELVVVIVILGILAAIALPRLMSMEGEARTAVANSLYNSLRSGTNMVYAKVASAGQLSDNNYNVDLGDGTIINARYGYPNTNSNANIANLFEDLSNRVAVTGTAAERFVWIDGRAECGVTYRRAENPGDRPIITPDTDLCD